MSEPNPPNASLGRVVSLHLHPATSGEPLRSVPSVELRSFEGVVGDLRYFKRTSRSDGKPSKRQISLIEREQIAAHVKALGLQALAPGVVRSNVETEGIDLVAFVGKRLRLGPSAVIEVYEPREPCQQMEALAPGLKQSMLNGRQGVIAQVVEPGVVNVGDPILAL